MYTKALFVETQQNNSHQKLKFIYFYKNICQENKTDCGHFFQNKYI